MDHQHFLGLAYTEAIKAFQKGEVPVGSIIVYRNKIIARTHNTYTTEKSTINHAEILAIRQANDYLKNWRLDGCILYTNLEPCLMCSGAIMNSRISKVYFSAADENDGCILSNYTLFDDKLIGHKVDWEYLPDERSKELLHIFFKNKRSKQTI